MATGNERRDPPYQIDEQVRITDVAHANAGEVVTVIKAEPYGDVTYFYHLRRSNGDEIALHEGSLGPVDKA